MQDSLQGQITQVSEVGGMSALADPNREIGFGFGSCSCRACERARRSCVGVRGDVLLNAGASNGKMYDSGAGFPLGTLNCYFHGF